MNLLMISGDRSVLEGKRSAFWYTLQGLRRHWERIDIICPQPASRAPLTGDGSETVRDLEEGQVFFHPNPRGLLFQQHWIVSQGSKLQAEHDYGAMTIHEYPPFYNGRAGLRLSAKTGVPALLEVHHIVGLPSAANLSEWIGRVWSRWYLPGAGRRAAAVRTVNGEVRDILAAWGVPGHKIAVLPSFYLDRSLLQGETQPPKEYDLAFCARLEPNKGLNAVLEALSHIPDCSLIVIGDGSQRSSCEQYARSLGIADRVTFAGWLPTQEDVAQAVKSARIFLMNSSSEGGPRSALEAMACGLPVIATPVGVMTDVVQEGKNGLLTTGEASDVADCIRTLLSQPELCEEMEKNASAVLDRFERDRLIQDYSDFLRNLL